MPNPINKLTVVFLVFIIGVMVAVSAWDYLSGDQERWVHYVNPDNLNVLGEYGSQEECVQHMQSNQGPSGCRRVDGPYRALNIFTGKVL